MYFIDITPYVFTRGGDRIELGTTRYEVPDEYVANEKQKYDTTGSVDQFTPGQVRLAPWSHYSSDMQLRIRTTNADVPQPQPISTITESVEKDGNTQ